jgi:hypothetical protein
MSNENEHIHMLPKPTFTTDGFMVENKGKEARKWQGPIVYVTGHSGGGKTVQFGFLCWKYNGLGFGGDKTGMRVWTEYPELAQEEFGCTPDPGEDGPTFFYRAYAPTPEEIEQGMVPFTGKKHRRLFHVMQKYVGGKLIYVAGDPTADYESHEDEALREGLLYQPKYWHGGKMVPMVPAFIGSEMCSMHDTEYQRRKDADLMIWIDSEQTKRKSKLDVRPDTEEWRERGIYEELFEAHETVNEESLQSANLFRVTHNYDYLTSIGVCEEVVERLAGMGFHV